MSQKKIKNEQLALLQKTQELLGTILNAYIDCPQEVKDAIKDTDLGFLLEDQRKKIQEWQKSQVSPILDPTGQPIDKRNLKVVN